MKTLIYALPLLAMSLPVMADDLINKAEFDVVAEKAGDTSFAVSLAQTARLLNFCGQKDKAKEVRDYLQPVMGAVARQSFQDATGTDASKQNMRGMFLSRQVAAAMASEMSTMSMLEEMKPVEGAQKDKLCAYADKGYNAVVEMRAKTKAANQPTPKQ